MSSPAGPVLPPVYDDAVINWRTCRAIFVRAKSDGRSEYGVHNGLASSKTAMCIVFPVKAAYSRSEATQHKWHA